MSKYGITPIFHYLHHSVGILHALNIELHNERMYVSPESALAIVLPNFQADSEGKQITVRGERSRLLR